MRNLRLLLPLSLVLAACGGGDDGPDLSSPEVVFDAAMEAVSRDDLGALWPLLSSKAMAKFQRDLRHWQLLLRDPEDGPAIRAEVLRLRPQTTEAEFEAARSGAIEEVWKFFLWAKPRPAKPKTTAIRIEADRNTVRRGYLDVHGTERVVTLVRSKGKWYVDDLPL